MTEPLPPVPKERDYPDSTQGAMDYARDFGEWLRSYIERRNEHRRAAIDMLSKAVAENTADLERGERRPGWVHVQIGLLRADIKALLDDNRGLRRRQNAILTIAATGLVSIVVTLVSIIMMGVGK